jgi:RHS repeat-associated protein
LNLDAGRALMEMFSVNNTAEINSVNYTRGNDLSGTLQRAGGIGGLLARSDYDQEIPGSPTMAFYHADGNGNVTAMIYPDQQVAAKYIYDPFGNMLAMSGPLANLNKYRFSSKEWEGNAGLYYYGYRFYDPCSQRWPNRDPLGDFVELHSFFPQVGLFLQAGRGVPPSEDLDGPDLYLFIGNDPILKPDPYGLCPCDVGGCVLAIGNCALAVTVATLACIGPDVAACRLAGIQAILTCAAVSSACAGCGPPPYTNEYPGGENGQPPIYTVP